MSRIWEVLFSKNGLAAKQIAEMLIPIHEGERIPRVEDFENQLSIGRGTVQGALKVLESLHAVQLESRGHLGTFVVKRNLHLLKEIAGVGDLMGAMPLPYSTLYEGLATGLIEVSDQLMNGINLVYMRGSKQRVEGLKSRRYDFIVLSQLAAEEEMKHDDQLTIALDFGPNTYVSSHKVFLADPKKNAIERGMRVGIDYSSFDQLKITLLECEDIDVELVSINYMQLFENLQNGTLDAAVWNSDESRSVKAFKQVNFQSQQAREIAKKATTSVILIEKQREEVFNYFSQLDKEEVKQIQQLVVDHEKIPHY
ncbi:GntR family transcriptional regulator YhfZ [Sporosarcina sp. 6E9]|uniref:GntR family transcriptional regulator YhfZ n=1 Tax=Sporosarcina sp. 6E9 TaxID=2819235 RepID=UPI001B316C3A|nr:GntR family transcriptional regulator YhfZ [Sporosarcina sp. 6E9]